MHRAGHLFGLLTIPARISQAWPGRASIWRRARLLIGAGAVLMLAGSSLATSRQSQHDFILPIEVGQLGSAAGDLLTYREFAIEADGRTALHRLEVPIAAQADYRLLTIEQPNDASAGAWIGELRLALGIGLLAAIALGLAWLWRLHVRPRLTSTRLRDLRRPREMIEIRLAETV